jgi:hypothetical protein
MMKKKCFLKEKGKRKLFNHAAAIDAKRKRNKLNPADVLKLLFMP